MDKSFKKSIIDQENSQYIECPQETWFKSHLDYVINGYISIRRDRNKRNGGRVATFVKQGIGYSVVEATGEQNVVLVEIWEGTEKVRIMYYYNPGKTRTYSRGSKS